ncbi:hypothetical protein [Schlesneria sp. DSM 10557]|uniref:hypothetical protein n=1 Tax=Schlesneria sp. DSM 10557 TaxID=3044399 RepID=UPI00359FEBF1
MPGKSRGGLFRTRNILGAALLVGLGVGLYLGKWGLGTGGSDGWGTGGGETQVSVNSDGVVNPPQTLKSEVPARVYPVTDVVRVVIDEDSYLLRQESDGSKDVPITLPELIKLVEQAKGDADGLRVRIYENMTARAEAEENLKQELSKAGVPDASIFWVPITAE